MPLISTGEVRLNVEIRGSGEQIITFIHGNVGCADWFELVHPLLPKTFRAVFIEWRGCGASDKPSPSANFENYSVRQHAYDIVRVLRLLGIGKCHLATHSTGGIIGTYMLLIDPERFNRVLALDPVAPTGLPFDSEAIRFFGAARRNYPLARWAIATATPTLFDKASLAPGRTPKFAADATLAQRTLFDRLVRKALVASEGVWLGTAKSLTREYQRGELRSRQREITHEHLILWGTLDSIIPVGHMIEMANEMPKCRLRIVPGVGHSMNCENPHLYSRILSSFFTA